MSLIEHDLIAIGGGTAGLVSSAGAAYLGVRSALVERGALGGDGERNDEPQESHP